MSLFSLLKMFDKQHLRLASEGEEKFEQRLADLTQTFFITKEHNFKSLLMYVTIFSHIKLNFFFCKNVLYICFIRKVLVVAAEKL